jgi:hypothetical protein
MVSTAHFLTFQMLVLIGSDGFFRFLLQVCLE